LLTRILAKANFTQAVKRVKKNKGTSGNVGKRLKRNLRT